MEPHQKANDDSFSIYLYFFDEISGHIPLFTYSRDSLNDENEKQILTTHPVWWHQEKFLETQKFLAMDLEIGEVVYSATLFFYNAKRKKKRSGMDSTKWEKELFVLIVRSPSSISFITQEILYELKTRINMNIGEKLCYLVEYYFSFNEKFEEREDQNRIFYPHWFLSNQKEAIELKLTEICQDLMPQTSFKKLQAYLEDEKERLIQNQNVPQAKELLRPKKLHFLIPTIKSIEKTEITKKKVIDSKLKRVKIFQVKQDPINKRIQVFMRNENSHSFHNITIKITQSEGFFKKEILVIQIKEWPVGEERTVEFEPKTELGTIYFLRIEDEHETIRIKRILG
ncbi:MAG: hypothetical protein ACFFAU_03710 [Candidatus Hodarchaeota archaeon]